MNRRRHRVVGTPHGFSWRCPCRDRVLELRVRRARHAGPGSEVPRVWRRRRDSRRRPPVRAVRRARLSSDVVWGGDFACELLRGRYSSGRLRIGSHSLVRDLARDAARAERGSESVLPPCRRAPPSVSGGRFRSSDAVRNRANRGEPCPISSDRAPDSSAYSVRIDLWGVCVPGRVGEFRARAGVRLCWSDWRRRMGDVRGQFALGICAHRLHRHPDSVFSLVPAAFAPSAILSVQTIPRGDGRSWKRR